MKTVLTALLSLFSLSCSKTEVISEETFEIPESSLSYSSMDNWAFHPEKSTFLPYYALDIAVIDKNLEIEKVIPINNNSAVNTGIDVFFVHPTVLTQNEIPENIDIAEQQDFLISGTIVAQGGLLAKYGRLFAPRYRQSTGKTYQDATDKKLQAKVIGTSYADIKAAFLDYLENYNGGNKIILAGHSQGSYLLGMLVRDLFDNNPDLRSKLITAVLAGMGHVYAPENSFKGGWWENIPLCTSTSEMACIQSWASFDESQTIRDINFGLPEFNPYLIKEGLVYKEFDETTDWFVQDFSYYSEQTQALDYYIAPDASYQLGGSNNFITFSDMYQVRHRRDELTKVALSVSYSPIANDKRPNDLAEEKLNPNYPYWGYHTKDYHIYLWALMQQIDMKIANL